MSFPVPLSDVLRSNGLKFAYWDETSGSWARRIRRPTFAHLCALRLPPSSPLASFNSLPVDKTGPSSYETIASQASCPAGVNVHEYLAVQSLLAGTSRRWITLLTELGSSNINFSTEAIAVIVSHIAIQCGPQLDDDVLGTNHGAFNDPKFCEALLQQMANKLEGIASNWREVFAMDIILTLTLRGCEILRKGSQFTRTEHTDDSLHGLSCSTILTRARKIVSKPLFSPLHISSLTDSYCRHWTGFVCSGRKQRRRPTRRLLNAIRRIHCGPLSCASEPLDTSQIVSTI